MTQRLCAVLGGLLLATAFVLAQPGRSVQVDVNYTGSGTVDASHRIYIAVWDSAEFNAVPTAVKSVESKTGTVMFTDVQSLPSM